jgi:hypothetical protein
MATRLEGHPSMYVSINAIQIFSLKCLLCGEGGGSWGAIAAPPPHPPYHLDLQDHYLL